MTLIFLEMACSVLAVFLMKQFRELLSGRQHPFLEFDDGPLGPAIGDMLDGFGGRREFLHGLVESQCRFGHHPQRFRHSRILRAPSPSFVSGLFDNISVLMASKRGSSRLRVDGVSEDSVLLQQLTMMSTNFILILREP